MEVTLTSPPTPLERAQAFLELLRGGQNYDEPVLDGLTLERAWDGGIVCRLQAARKHANRYGTMHGGCIATLVDVIGSAAIITQADRGGVSLSISTHYLAPMPIGDVVEIEATVAKIGKQIGTAVVSLRDATTGALVAQGTHVKALVPHSDSGPAMRALVAEQRRTKQQQFEKPQEQRRVESQGRAPQRSKL
ncbi:acyl-CoA thioesterase 13 [Monoraphidium neglectum]|uniref:Acyl-coenzyme A thioesterase 13 n=1 Tax=Monoraphidium neglectum TaxID=145388 RepID=A0A0D2IZT0_9CHLO|nr:acyl-CoA thioesterase 13 [Monoraphidium neglectum]KIY93362.1 acyl-CoA thioesterase 13 [Monoraphidium neglectum]|eukprot:XP_013892382.1 acyl-CoA thioesterase 13 [Monoraphidium neglectum]